MMMIWLLFFVPIFESYQIHIDTRNVVNTIDETYASWNVDSSQNRGFFHIDFENENLLAAAKSLQPSILRFGGTGNDLLYYGTKTNPCNYSKYSHCTTAYNTGTGCCMNVSHWKSFSTFASKASTPILFGVSFDMIRACRDGANYVWNESHIREWIEELYLNSNTDIIWGFELGNEINNNQVVCNLSASQQVDAFETFNTIRNELFSDPKPVLVGPDTGYLNASEWLETFLEKNTVDLHAVTHHVYPGITLDNWNQSSVLDRPLSDISWYAPIVEKTSFRMWSGEEGPHGGGDDGTCGVGSSACGVFASSFWYADDMALRASKGFTHFQRQDLVGARYGLVSIPHDDEYLTKQDEVGLSSDFWINFFWKRTLGTSVLKVTNDDNILRVYAFSGEPVSPYAEYKNMSVSLVVINQGTHSQIFDLTVDDRIPKETLSWCLQSGLDNIYVNTTKTKVNGVQLPASISNGMVIEKSPIPGKRQAKSSSVLIEPVSVTFLMVWV